MQPRLTAQTTMATANILNEDFTESKTEIIEQIPKIWKVSFPPPYYTLNMKMCQLSSLTFTFKFSENRTPAGPNSEPLTITEEPKRILKLDLSLNDLFSLDKESLLHFQQLRFLDASLNQLHRITLEEALPNLVFLNLSHNFIKRLEGLAGCSALLELNLNMNELKEMSSMPLLSYLTVLNINSNKLESLYGIQSLPRLKELYARNNQLTDIDPLASSFDLTIIDVSHNQVRDLYGCLSVLQSLKYLIELHMTNNPVQNEIDFSKQITQLTSVRILDGITIRSLIDSGTLEQAQQHQLSLVGPGLGPGLGIPDGEQATFGEESRLKAAVKRIFDEHLYKRRLESEESISFLQKRILSIKSDLAGYEVRLSQDLEACLQYLEHVAFREVPNFDPNYFRDILLTPGAKKPWEKEQLPQKEEKKNYKEIKNTDQVLQIAAEILEKKKN